MTSTWSYRWIWMPDLETASLVTFILIWETFTSSDLYSCCRLSKDCGLLSFLICLDLIKFNFIFCWHVIHRYCLCLRITSEAFIKHCLKIMKRIKQLFLLMNEELRVDLCTIRGKYKKIQAASLCLCRPLIVFSVLIHCSAYHSCISVKLCWFDMTLWALDAT